VLFATPSLGRRPRLQASIPSLTGAAKGHDEAHLMEPDNLARSTISCEG
jgi:hypothetical protein